LKARELITIAVFLLGLSQIPTLLAEFVRTGLWFAELRESEELFSQDRSLFLMQVSSLAISFTKASLILSFVLLPNWWAGLVPKVSTSIEVPSLSLDSVQVTLVALTGLVLIALALSDLAEYLVSWHTRRAFEDSAINVAVSRVDYWPPVVASAVRFLIGAWLVFGAHGLVELWRQLRSGESMSNAA
jgi:hypothetical protein